MDTLKTFWKVKLIQISIGMFWRLHQKLTFMWQMLLFVCTGCISILGITHIGQVFYPSHRFLLFI